MSKQNKNNKRQERLPSKARKYDSTIGEPV
jgi:hypothetical protein